MPPDDPGPSPDQDAGDAAAPAGDRAALDALFSAAYEELRRLARAIRRDDPGATIDPTALVNEAWIKLAATPQLAAWAASRLHFRRIAGRAMRQVLVEAARRRHAHKRGGPGAVMVTLDDGLAAALAPNADVLALDTALDDLARFNPRQAALIESRFFAGLDVAETAEALGVSEATVQRDWRAARAWLVDALRPEP